MITPALSFGFAARLYDAVRPSYPAASSQSALVAPLPKPVVHTPVQPAPPSPPSPPSQATTTPLAHPRTTSPAAPVVSLGGREQPPAPALGSGDPHRVTLVPAGLAELLPTPLALVGIGESMPASDAWPTWVLTLFTLLLSVEAFLLVRLVQARRCEESEELEELPDL